MSTHWNGTIAHASSVASSAVQYGTFAPIAIDDAVVFVEGHRRDDQRDAEQRDGAEEPDQRERDGGEDDAAEDSGHWDLGLGAWVLGA